jgi:hypothetical protein
VAFSHRPIVLQSQGRRRPPDQLVGELLTLRGLGTTDLERALAAAASQLERAASPDRLAVLMSDCLATAGADPLGPDGAASLRGVDRLHVLGTSLDAGSLAAGRALARRGGGRHVVVLRPHEVARAVSSLLA